MKADGDVQQGVRHPLVLHDSSKYVSSITSLLKLAQLDSTLNIKIYSTRTTALTSMFLTELREKHSAIDIVFLGDSAS